ncbi:hypothetical protein AgCh_033719 [Apium graveolens]
MNGCDSESTVGDFDGHSKRVLSCAFKPTRAFGIVTCGEDFLVKFYVEPSLKFKLSHRDHTNFVNCVRFSPDCTKFITANSVKKGSWSADSKQVSWITSFMYAFLSSGY